MPGRQTHAPTPEDLRVLLVDDEPRVVQALERMLVQRLEDDCDVATATSGADALHRMSRQPFDVLISDMRMPGMDGAELARRAHAEHPAMLRIILSGHMAEDAAMRALPYAHQLLAKPCSSAELLEIIRRMRSLREMVPSQRLRRSIGSLDRLPVAADVRAELEALLGADKPSSAEIAVLIERDPALVAMTLRAANTAYFRRGAAVHTVERAVALLGLETLRGLVGTPTSSPVAVEAPRLREEALRTARLARHLARGPVGESRASEPPRPVPRRTTGDIEFLSGLLIHTGRLVAALAATERDAESRGLAPSHSLDSRGDDAVTADITHARMGAYLLGLWGFPRLVIESVARRLDTPDADSEREVLAVQLAARVLDGRPIDPAWLAAFPRAMEAGLPRAGDD